jgi:hypothetical protein
LPAERNAVVSASIAFDYIMGFGGSFADHIIPEKAHVISVSFLVDSLRKQRGGVAGNICYTLALLGESSHLVGAVGNDFAPYRAAFEELGIGLDFVIQDDAYLTASAFMMADLKSTREALLLVHAIGTPAQRAEARRKLHDVSVALGDVLGARRWSGGERDAVALTTSANHSSARASAQAHGHSVPRVSLPVIRDWRNAVERTAGAT